MPDIFEMIKKSNAPPQVKNFYEKVSKNRNESSVSSSTSSSSSSSSPSTSSSKSSGGNSRSSSPAPFVGPVAPTKKQKPIPPVVEKFLSNVGITPGVTPSTPTKPSTPTISTPSGGGGRTSVPSQSALDIVISKLPEDSKIKDVFLTYKDKAKKDEKKYDSPVSSFLYERYGDKLSDRRMNILNLIEKGYQLRKEKIEASQIPDWLKTSFNEEYSENIINKPLPRGKVTVTWITGLGKERTEDVETNKLINGEFQEEIKYKYGGYIQQISKGDNVYVKYPSSEEVQEIYSTVYTETLENLYKNKDEIPEDIKKNIDFNYLYENKNAYGWMKEAGVDYKSFKDNWYLHAIGAMSNEDWTKWQQKQAYKYFQKTGNIPSIAGVFDPTAQNVVSTYVTESLPEGFVGPPVGRKVNVGLISESQWDALWLQYKAGELSTEGQKPTTNTFSGFPKEIQVGAENIIRKNFTQSNQNIPSEYLLSTPENIKNKVIEELKKDEEFFMEINKLGNVDDYYTKAVALNRNPVQYIKEQIIFDSRPQITTSLKLSDSKYVSYKPPKVDIPYQGEQFGYVQSEAGATATPGELFQVTGGKTGQPTEEQQKLIKEGFYPLVSPKTFQYITIGGASGSPYPYELARRIGPSAGAGLPTLSRPPLLSGISDTIEYRAKYPPGPSQLEKDLQKWELKSPSGEIIKITESPYHEMTGFTPKSSQYSTILSSINTDITSIKNVPYSESITNIEDTLKFIRESPTNTWYIDKNQNDRIDAGEEFTRIQALDYYTKLLKDNKEAQKSAEDTLKELEFQKKMVQTYHKAGYGLEETTEGWKPYLAKHSDMKEYQQKEMREADWLERIVKGGYDVLSQTGTFFTSLGGAVGDAWGGKPFLESWGKRFEEDIIRGSFEQTQKAKYGARTGRWGEYWTGVFTSPTMTNIIYPYGLGVAAGYLTTGATALGAGALSRGGGALASSLYYGGRYSGLALATPFIVGAGAKGYEIYQQESKGELPTGAFGEYLGGTAIGFLSAGAGAEFGSGLAKTHYSEGWAEHLIRKGWKFQKTRVALTDKEGNVIYDKFGKPKTTIDPYGKLIEDPYNFRKMFPSEAKELYRAISKKFHPDKGSTPMEAEKFKIISQAYEAYGREYPTFTNRFTYTHFNEPLQRFSKFKSDIPIGIESFKSRARVTFGRQSVKPGRELTLWEPQPEYMQKLRTLPSTKATPPSKTYPSVTPSQLSNLPLRTEGYIFPSTGLAKVQSLFTSAFGRGRIIPLVEQKLGIKLFPREGKLSVFEAPREVVALEDLTSTELEKVAKLAKPKSIEEIISVVRDKKTGEIVDVTSKQIALPETQVIETPEPSGKIYSEEIVSTTGKALSPKFAKLKGFLEEPSLTTTITEEVLPTLEQYRPLPQSIKKQIIQRAESIIKDTKAKKIESIQEKISKKYKELSKNEMKLLTARELTTTIKKYPKPPTTIGEPKQTTPMSEYLSDIGDMYRESFGLEIPSESLDISIPLSKKTQIAQIKQRTETGIESIYKNRLEKMLQERFQPEKPSEVTGFRMRPFDMTISKKSSLIEEMVSKREKEISLRKSTERQLIDEKMQEFLELREGQYEYTQAPRITTGTEQAVDVVWNEVLTTDSGMLLLGKERYLAISKDPISGESNIIESVNSSGNKGQLDAIRYVPSLESQGINTKLREGQTIRMTKTIRDWFSQADIPLKERQSLNAMLNKSSTEVEVLTGGKTIRTSVTTPPRKIGDIEVTLEIGKDTLDLVYGNVSKVGSNYQQPILGYGKTSQVSQNIVEYMRDPNAPKPKLSPNEVESILKSGIDNALDENKLLGTIRTETQELELQQRQAEALKRFAESWLLPRKKPSMPGASPQESLDILLGRKPYIKLAYDLELKKSISYTSAEEAELARKQAQDTWFKTWGGSELTNKIDISKVLSTEYTGAKQGEYIGKVSPAEMVGQTKKQVYRGILRSKYKPLESQTYAKIREAKGGLGEGKELGELLQRMKLEIKKPLGVQISSEQLMGLTRPSNITKLDSRLIAKDVIQKSTEEQALKTTEKMEETMLEEKPFESYTKYLSKKVKGGMTEGEYLKAREAELATKKEVIEAEQKGIERLTKESIEQINKELQEGRYDRQLSRQLNREITTQGERQISRQTQKQIARNMSKNISKVVTRNIEKQINRNIQRNIERQIERNIERNIERTIERQIERVIERQIERQIERYPPTFIGLETAYPPIIPVSETPMYTPKITEAEVTEYIEPFIRIIPKGEEKPKKKQKRKPRKTALGYFERKYKTPDIWKAGTTKAKFGTPKKENNKVPVFPSNVKLAKPKSTKLKTKEVKKPEFFSLTGGI